MFRIQEIFDLRPDSVLTACHKTRKTVVTIQDKNIRKIVYHFLNPELLNRTHSQASFGRQDKPADQVLHTKRL